MANLSDDIHVAVRYPPPMLSIDEGPFQMGTIRDPIAEGTEGAQQLGPERARVYSDLSPEDKDRCTWKVQKMTKDDRAITTLINDMRNIKMTMSRMQLNSKFVNNMLPEWGRFVTAVKLNREPSATLHRNQATHFIPADRVVVQNVQGRQNRGQGNNARDVDEQPVQDLALNVDNVFQADDCDALI
ncbi:hypothetical protein Tco_0114941 [Tanacetum coccineum]